MYNQRKQYWQEETSDHSINCLQRFINSIKVKWKSSIVLQYARVSSAENDCAYEAVPKWRNYEQKVSWYLKALGLFFRELEKYT